MKRIIILPARLDSTRLPRKMLMEIENTPIIVHAYNNIKKLKESGRGVDEIFVTSPDQEIINVCQEFGIQTIKLNKPVSCGTHACLLAHYLIGGDADLVNVQGDCVNIYPESIMDMYVFMQENPDCLCTLHYETTDLKEAQEPSKVKMVFNLWDDVMYNSRSLIPYFSNRWNIHIGSYGFPKNLIPRILNMYEQGNTKTVNHSENLEQLAWIERGIKMHSIKSFKTLSIDTQEDYELFKRNYFDR